MLGSRARPAGIHDFAVGRQMSIGLWVVPVQTKLSDVPDHIDKPPGIRLRRGRWMGLLPAVIPVPRILTDGNRLRSQKPVHPSPHREAARISLEEIGRMGARAAGVFPLGLGRQAESLARGGREPFAVL